MFENEVQQLGVVGVLGQNSDGVAVQLRDAVERGPARRQEHDRIRRKITSVWPVCGATSLRTIARSDLRWSSAWAAAARSSSGTVLTRTRGCSAAKT